MAKVTFDDKVDLTTKDVPEINKITADNINQLKNGVNSNEDSINSLQGASAIYQVSSDAEMLAKYNEVTPTDGSLLIRDDFTPFQYWLWDSAEVNKGVYSGRDVLAGTATDEEQLEGSTNFSNDGQLYDKIKAELITNDINDTDQTKALEVNVVHKVKNDTVINVGEYENLTPVSTISGSYLNELGNVIGGFSDYTINVYKISKVRDLQVVGKSKGNNVMVLGYFSSPALNATHLVDGAVVITDNVTPTDINHSKSTFETIYLAVCSFVDYNIDVVGSTNVLKTNKSNTTLTGEVVNEISKLEEYYIDNTTTSAISNINYDIYKYEVEPLTAYDFFGYNKGNEVLCIVELKSNSLTETNVVSRNLIINDNSKYSKVDVSIVTNKDTNYVYVCELKTSHIEVRKGGIKTQCIGNSERIEKVEDRFFMNKNDVVIQMNDADTELAKILNSNYVDVKKLANIRATTYHNLTSSFVVPELNNTVTINVNVNSTANYTELSTIAVGTLDVYDLYYIDSITGTTTLNCTLIESNTNMIGETVPTDSSMYAFRVYNYEDVKRFKSNCFMRDVISFDKYHPTASMYNLIGDIFSNQIYKLAPSVSRVIIFGDSYVDGTNIEGRIASNLGVATVNEGLMSMRIEHIIDNIFIPYMSSYTPVDGDFFLFMMGTNNLADIFRNPTNKAEQVFNLSYKDIWLRAVHLIQAQLPKANYIIGSGFGTTDYY